MYTQEVMDKAVKRLKNPYWKEYYESAPSDACKERIAFNFAFSHYGIEDYFESGEEFRNERDRIESQLDLADWKHLLKYSGNNPWHTKCRNKVRELEAQKNEIK